MIVELGRHKPLSFYNFGQIDEGRRVMRLIYMTSWPAAERVIHVRSLRICLK